MVLYFGFVTKKVLKTYQCFSNCWMVFTQHQGGVDKRLGETAAGRADQRDMPYSTMSCSAVKLGMGWGVCQVLLSFGDWLGSG